MNGYRPGRGFGQRENCMGYLLAAMVMKCATNIQNSGREAKEGPSHLVEGERLHSGLAGDGVSNQIKWAMRGSPPYSRRPGTNSSLPCGRAGF